MVELRPARALAVRFWVDAQVRGEKEGRVQLAERQR